MEKEKAILCLEEMKTLKEKLCGVLTRELDKDIGHVDTHEAGEIVDMIKDLAEAEKYCHEACYFKSVHEAMEQHSEKYGWIPTWPDEWGSDRYGWRPPRPMYTDMYGYNNGSRSNGGNGVQNGSYGYRPGQARDSQGQFVSEGGRMGYHEGMAEYRMPMYGPESEYGRAYDKYQESKRHFTETGNAKDRDEMSMHAKEHLNSVIMTMGEMYKESDPELKRQIKANLGKLIGEMV